MVRSGQQGRLIDHPAAGRHAGRARVSGLEDTEEMDRGRAETHLRLVAEAELRRAMAHPRDGAPAPPDLPGAAAGAPVLRQRSAVADALYDLPNYQREAIALQYYADLSELETARTIGLSVGSVHAHTARGVSALQDALNTGVARVSRVAQVLIAVRALDHEVAEQILDEFALAFGTRRARSLGQHGLDPRSLMRSPAAHLPLGMLIRSRPSMPFMRSTAWSPDRAAANAPRSSGPQEGPCRVVPLGQVIPVRGGDVSGEIYLLSYALTAACARFTVVVRARGEFVPPGIEHNGMYRPFAVFPVHQFTATDDLGTRYQMGFSGRRGRRPVELAGEITVHPRPPSGIRWMDLTTAQGEPAVRIDLNQPNRLPSGTGVAVSEDASSPGEHLLDHIATRLLLLTLAFPQEILLHPAVPRPEPFSCVAAGLGDVVAALQACGALSLLSPVPGQLAALCANLNVGGHGIIARPARDLPEPWLSLLAHYRRRKPQKGLGGDGCAATAIAFPELDGIRLSILGLNNADNSTVLYAHASGTPDAAADFPLTLWVRDNGGRWHATRISGWDERDDGEMTMRLEVVPPLGHTAARLDVLAAGSSAEARATLPVRWQLPHLGRGGPAARRPGRRRRIATSADAAMVAMRRVTGIFPGAAASWDGA
jgi:Sigma-70, region 4